ARNWVPGQRTDLQRYNLGSRRPGYVDVHGHAGRLHRAERGHGDADNGALRALDPAGLADWRAPREQLYSDRGVEHRRDRANERHLHRDHRELPRWVL